VLLHGSDLESSVAAESPDELRVTQSHPKAQPLHRLGMEKNVRFALAYPPGACYPQGVIQHILRPEEVTP